MSKYKIISNGEVMGIYNGKDEDEALDNFAKDAGYKNYKDLLKNVPGSTREEDKVIKVGKVTSALSLKDLEYLASIN